MFVLTAVQLASLIFFSFREKQIMCLTSAHIWQFFRWLILSHLSTNLEKIWQTSPNSKRHFDKNFYETEIIKCFYKSRWMGLLRRRNNFFLNYFSSFDRFQVWHLTWHFDEDFFLVSLFTIKIEFWSSKRFGMYSFLYSNCYFWYVKKLSW